MPGLPDDFADTLARVIARDSHEAAAEVIDAAARLNDAELRDFLRIFAARVRESPAPVTGAELRRFLQAARTRREP
jgi:hypothetical protein